MNYSNINLTKEQITICNKCHKDAMLYFGIKHGDNLVLHHKDTELRHNNIDRYIQWLPEDLIVLTNSEHAKLHMKLDNSPRHTTPHTDETKKKISKKLTGVPRPHTEEQNKHISDGVSKSVICVETSEIFKNASEAAKKYGCGRTAINNCLCGLSKTCCNLHWKYY